MEFFSRFRFDFNIDYDLLVLFYYLYNAISSHLGRYVIRRGVLVWSTGIAVHGALAVSMGRDPYISQMISSSVSEIKD